MIDKKEESPEKFLCARKLNRQIIKFDDEVENRTSNISYQNSNNFSETKIQHARIYKGRDAHNGLQKPDIDDSLWNGLYILIVILTSILFSFPILLLPQHNSIINSEYWYENMIVFCTTFVFTLFASVARRGGSCWW